MNQSQVLNTMPLEHSLDHSIPLDAAPLYLTCSDLFAHAGRISQLRNNELLQMTARTRCGY